jgi:hypothetical protein
MDVHGFSDCRKVSYVSELMQLCYYHLGRAGKEIFMLVHLVERIPKVPRLILGLLLLGGIAIFLIMVGDKLPVD